MPESRFPRALGLTEARPPMVWTAALLYVFGGFACLAAVVFPVSSSQPLRLDLVLGSLACAVGAGLWVAGWRVRPLHAQLTLALATLIISAVVADAATSGGVMLTAFAYPWITVYCAHFFSRRVIFAQALLISVSFGVGLMLDRLPNMTIDWVIVSATVSCTSLVLGYLSESLRHQADTDQLTGLLNRGGFLAAATRELAIASRTGSLLTLAVLDLDGFKQINDSLGHAAGDRLLAELGRSWRARLRAGDILARYGGDEFVLLLPATSQVQARELLQRLRVPELAIGWSAGVREWRPAENLPDCLARADRDLYAAKQSQRTDARRGEYHTGALIPSA